MKKFILSFFILLSINLHSQHLQFVGDSVLSSNIGEWKKYNNLYLVTDYNSPIYYKFIVSVFDDEDNLVMATDTTDIYDSLGVGDTVFVDWLFNPIVTSFYEDIGEYFLVHKRLKGGDYLFKVKFYDTLNNFLGDSAIKAVTVKEETLPSLVRPYDNVTLWDSTINATVFEWRSPKGAGAGPFYYHFKIFEVDSTQILDSLEWAFENNNLIYDIVLTDTVHNPGVHIDILTDSGRWYGWSVKPYLDPTLTTPAMVTNEGMSYPFIFSKSSVKRDDDPQEPLCCINGDGFENSTPNAWLMFKGTRVNLQEIFQPQRAKNSLLYPHGKYNWSTTGFIPGRFEITNSPNTDILTSIPEVPDNGGLHALRMGDRTGDAEAQMIKRTFTVDQCNKTFKFRYAFFRINQFHRKFNEPIFSIKVYRGRNNGLLDNIDKYIIQGDDRSDITKDLNTMSGPLLYDPWDCKTIDLTKYVGQTVTIEIMVSDCPTSPCFGYLFIDFCGNTNADPEFTLNSTFCNLSLPIVANGSASKSLAAWIWTVQASDGLGNGTGPEIISTWRYGKGAENNMTLNDLIRATGKQCGYFRVKLGGGNSCSDWQEEVKLIQISCPQDGLAGVDKCCPSGSCNIQIGKNAVAGNTYIWSPWACLSSNTVANPFFNSALCTPPISTKATYVLQVTDALGCVGYDTVDIYATPPTVTSITQDSTQTLCDLFLEVFGNNYTSIEWSWSEPGTGLTKKDKHKKFIFPRYDQNVTVTVKLTNPCGFVTSTTTVLKRKTYRNLQDLHLKFPNVINVTSNYAQNRVMTIYEDGIAPGAPNAYFGSYYARLDILNRWGGITTVWEYNNNTTFNNGDLKWNGKVGGQFYQSPSGSVFWRLALSNCRNKDYEEAYHVIGDYICTKRKWNWWSLSYICKEGYWDWTTRIWNELYINP